MDLKSFIRRERQLRIGCHYNRLAIVWNDKCFLIAVWEKQHSEGRHLGRGVDPSGIVAPRNVSDHMIKLIRGRGVRIKINAVPNQRRPRINSCGFKQCRE